MIDLPPEQLDLVRRLPAGRVPKCEVRAFGSRTAGGVTPQPESHGLTARIQGHGCQFSKFRRAGSFKGNQLLRHIISPNFLNCPCGLLANSRRLTGGWRKTG